RKTHGSALFALAASFAFAGIVVARPLVLDGLRRAAAEIAARQLAVRIAVLEAQFALTIAGHAPLRHEELPGAEAVAQIVRPVAEHAFGVALVDPAVLVADAARPIADDVGAGPQEAVVRQRGSR